MLHYKKITHTCVVGKYRNMD